MRASGSRPAAGVEQNVKIAQDIKDLFRASALVIAIILLISAVIGIYNALANPESAKIYGFITFAMTLHDDIDENDIQNDILSFASVITGDSIESPESLEFAMSRESGLIRAYRDSYNEIVSPNSEMRSLKESLKREGNLFIASYSYLREALKYKTNDEEAACLSNVEKAIQSLDEAINLRLQNRAALESWKSKIEAEMPD